MMMKDDRHDQHGERVCECVCACVHDARSDGQRPAVALRNGWPTAYSCNGHPVTDRLL